MSFTLPLILGLLAADVQQPFTSPKSVETEYGHGLAHKALAGWVSLFNWPTTFGWKDANIIQGGLSSGNPPVRLVAWNSKPKSSAVAS